jgi:hypothetical protein
MPKGFFIDSAGASVRTADFLASMSGLDPSQQGMAQLNIGSPIRAAASGGTLPDLATLTMTQARLETFFNPFPDYSIFTDITFDALSTGTDYTFTNMTLDATGLGPTTAATPFYAITKSPFAIAPQIGMQTTIQAMSGASSAAILLGLHLPSSPGNNRVGVFYDQANTRFQFLIDKATKTTVTQNTNAITMAVGDKFGVIFHNRSMSLFVKRAADTRWVFVAVLDDMTITTGNAAFWDLQDPAVLATLLPGFSGTYAAVGGWRVSGLKVGHAGYVNIQNTFYIKDHLGNPLRQTDGSYFIQGTAVLPQNAVTNQYQQNNNGIWRVNPYTFEATEVGKIYLKSGGRFVCSDCSGAVFLDTRTGQWTVTYQNNNDQVFSGGFAAFKPQQLMWNTYENLTGGFHILDNPVVMQIPTLNGNAFWDVDIIYRDSIGMYDVSCAEAAGTLDASNFHNSLYRGPSLTQLTLVGRDTSGTVSEGGRFAQFNNIWYLFGSRVNNAISAYSLSATNGVLDVARAWTLSAFPGSASGAQPHPNLVVLPVGNNQSIVVMDTFSAERFPGAGIAITTYGRRAVLVSAWSTGQQNPLIRAPFTP